MPDRRRMNLMDRVAPPPLRPSQGMTPMDPVLPAQAGDNPYTMRLNSGVTPVPVNPQMPGSERDVRLNFLRSQGLPTGQEAQVPYAEGLLQPTVPGATAGVDDPNVPPGLLSGNGGLLRRLLGF